MTAAPLVSYAQNGEDVVLWRALRGVEHGRYVDVGANAPEQDSVTKLFYDRGWSGLDVEPVAEWADALRRERSRDTVAEVAVTATDGGEVVLHESAGTGLSTVRSEYAVDAVGLGHEIRERRVPTRTLAGLVAEHLGDQDVHFCKIDVEGAEADVLAGADLARWRPWVLVVEATRPNSTEQTHEEWEPGVLAAGYRFCLFDGLSRFYVRDDKAAELAPALSYPACPLDGYVRAEEVRLRARLDHVGQLHHRASEELDVLRRRDADAQALRAEVVRWRGIALERWSAAVSGPRSSVDDGARAELEALQRTVSWRVTAPLRAVRSRQLSGRRGTVA
ncbi:MAG: FkbM family methyltransferase [Actinomycetes bacterium]